MEISRSAHNRVSRPGFAAKSRPPAEPAAGIRCVGRNSGAGEGIRTLDPNLGKVNKAELPGASGCFRSLPDATIPSTHKVVFAYGGLRSHMGAAAEFRRLLPPCFRRASAEAPKQPRKQNQEGMS